MEAKTYLRVSAANLAFLFTGILIGAPAARAARYVFDTIVHAQTKEDTGSIAAKAEAPKPPPVPSCDTESFECITPGLTTGAAAFGVVLANRIASDQLMVNGYDPLKLQDLTLSTLQRKGILSTREVLAIVDGAKVQKPLRVNIR
jgi:hypothetical protein